MSAAFSSDSPADFAMPDANFDMSGILGLTFAISFGASSSTLIPNRPLKKSLIPLKMFDIVSVIGEKKFAIESNILLSVSSPNKPKVKNFNIPPRPATTASLKLPVS